MMSCPPHHLVWALAFTGAVTQPHPLGHRTPLSTPPRDHLPHHSFRFPWDGGKREAGGIDGWAILTYGAVPSTNTTPYCTSLLGVAVVPIAPTRPLLEQMSHSHKRHKKQGPNNPLHCRASLQALLPPSLPNTSLALPLTSALPCFPRGAWGTRHFSGWTTQHRHLQLVPDGNNKPTKQRKPPPPKKKKRKPCAIFPTESRRPGCAPQT